MNEKNVIAQARAAAPAATALQRMRAAFHINMLRAYPGKTHEEITAEIDKAIEAAPTATAEPVAWMATDEEGNADVVAWTKEEAARRTGHECGKFVPLYAAPAPQQAAPLTDALLQALIDVCNAALPVTNAAYNIGQNHEQWDTIKQSIAHLDKLRSQAHELIREVWAGSAASAGNATKAARDVLAERRRQVEAEGWTPEHDDMHGDGQMAVAAGYYALACGYPHERDSGHVPTYWPWAPRWWKPSDKRRNLIKAGALIIAEIERIDRAAMAATKEK